jgi:hypothetical protein
LLMLPPCFLDMEVFIKKEPIPLKSCPPFDYKKSAGAKSSALGIANSEVCYIVGTCEGFKEEFMARFTAIEASHSERESVYSSINYDLKGGRLAVAGL